MNVLVLNGSPRGEKSNTMRLTNAFLEGMDETISINKEILPVYRMDIKPCTGCFHCWNKTPGKCCISDDMASVIDKILAADFIIWSFPLYYYGLPSKLKALMDRQLPMSLPYMTEDSDTGSHPPRYDMSGKRWLLMSTCGFYTSQGNYDSVYLQFDHYLGKGNYESITSGQGELFRVPELKNRTEEYLSLVRSAGSEFALGNITPETKQGLRQLILPREMFEQAANESWGLNDDPKDQTQPFSDPALTFTKQMAALYNPKSWSLKDRVLEMNYSDVNKTYQILMTGTGAKVLTEDFVPYTTKIETPLSLWMSIAKGETDGQKALMEQKYRVEGDFQLMIHWDDFFGVPTKPKAPEKKSLMLLMLLPWFPIWFFMAANPALGGALGILAGVGIPFLSFYYKTTIYECLSGLFAAIIGILAIMGVSISILVPASYLLFGLMWTITVFLKEPLTASYSKNGYGGDKALNNPLFLKTNRILTACWGALYLATPIWTYFLLVTKMTIFLILINTITPVLLGLFTKWFQTWYPSYFARRKN